MVEFQAVHSVDDSLANDVQRTFELGLRVCTVVQVCPASDEHLTDHWFARSRGVSELAGVGWNVPPPEQRLRLLGHDPRDDFLDARAFIRPRGQKNHAYAVRASRWQGESLCLHRTTQKLVRYLQ